MRKKCWSDKKMMKSYSHWQMVQPNCQEKRPRIPRTHSKAGTDRNERRSQRRTSKKLGGASTSRNKRGRRSLQRLLFYRHHVEPRVHLCVPKEESFPTPLKFFDVTSRSHINLKVMQEKRINDYWNVDGDRTLSDVWTGFTKFTLLSEKPPGYMWSGGRLTKIQATTRLDYLWPEVWIGMSKTAKKQEKQE